MNDPRILRRRLAWLKTEFDYHLPNHPGFSDSDGSWDANELIDELRQMLLQQEVTR